MQRDVLVTKSTFWTWFLLSKTTDGKFEVQSDEQKQQGKRNLSIKLAFFNIPSLTFTAFFQHQIIVFILKNQVKFFPHIPPFLSFCVSRVFPFWPITFGLVIDKRGSWWLQSPTWDIHFLLLELMTGFVSC